MNSKLKVSFVGVDQSPAIIAQAQQILAHHFWVSHQDFFTMARLTISAPSSRAKTTNRGRGKTELVFDLFLPLQKCGAHQEVKVSKKDLADNAQKTLSILFRSAGDALAAKAQGVKTHHRGGKATLQHAAFAA